MIVIVDYGMGNIGSILNMLKRIGATASVSSRAGDVEAAERLILPGVGAFDTGMEHLAASGLIPALNEQVLVRKTPVLGICLGMQLLTRSSEEGERPGLGWIEGTSKKFRFTDDQAHLKVPHMGWNTVAVTPGTRLFRGLEDQSRFYFVHSYYVTCDRGQDVCARTHYGHDFVSAVERGNIQGAQFHPEKSHKFGMRLLANFVDGS